MQDNSQARAGIPRVLIANTRVETYVLTRRVEAALVAKGYDVQTLRPALQGAKRSSSVDSLSFGRVKAGLLRPSLMRSVALAWRIIADRIRLSAYLQKVEPGLIIIFDDRP